MKISQDQNVEKENDSSAINEDVLFLGLNFFRILTQKDLEYPTHIMSTFISEKAGPPWWDLQVEQRIWTGVKIEALVLLKEFMQMLLSNCMLSCIQSIEHIFIEYLTYIRH